MDYEKRAKSKLEKMKEFFWDILTIVLIFILLYLDIIGKLAFIPTGFSVSLLLLAVLGIKKGYKVSISNLLKLENSLKKENKEINEKLDSAIQKINNINVNQNIQNYNDFRQGTETETANFEKKDVEYKTLK